MPRIKSNMVDFAFEELLHRINQYKYASGDFISESALAEELSISRTPVREAILRLLDLGLLEKKGSKIAVKPFSIEDVYEILQVREAIELMSVKLIFARGGLSAKELQTLEKENATLKESILNGAFEENFLHDSTFHDLIVSYSNNSRLINIRKQLSIQANRFRFITTLTASRYMDTLKEHERIVEGFQNKDEAAVCTAISEHLTLSAKNYQEILCDARWVAAIREFIPSRG